MRRGQSLGRCKPLLGSGNVCLLTPTCITSASLPAHKLLRRPTFVFLKGTTEVDRVMGADPGWVWQHILIFIHVYTAINWCYYPVNSVQRWRNCQADLLGVRVLSPGKARPWVVDPLLPLYQVQTRLASLIWALRQRFFSALWEFIFCYGISRRSP